MNIDLKILTAQQYLLLEFLDIDPMCIEDYGDEHEG